MLYLDTALPNKSHKVFLTVFHTKDHKEGVLQSITLVCFRDKDGTVKTHCCQGQQALVNFKMFRWVFHLDPFCPCSSLHTFVDG